MNPITKVTDPQTIIASEAPSSSDANAAGVTGGIGRRCILPGGDVGGWRSEENGAERWADLRRAKRREQSSKKRFDWWSSSSMLSEFIIVEIRNPNPNLTLVLVPNFKAVERGRRDFIGLRGRGGFSLGSRWVDRLQKNFLFWFY